jgi:selenide,water dikinase
MAADAGAAESHLVLAGGGHSHALLLRRWAMRPRRRPRARITLVSRSGSSVYSGMVPGVVAGLYTPEQAAIDLRRLCAAAAVRFIAAEIAGIELDQRRLLLLDRPPLAWDWLSLDVGAVSEPPAGERGVKPLEPFLAWAAGLEAGSSLTIRGGGAAAVELALALRARGLQATLLLRSQGLRLGSPAANRRGEALLRQAGVALRRQIDPESDGTPADLACTGSHGPAWLAAAGLPCDATGRILTEASLQVAGLPRIFASGDCGVIRSAPRPPSGVWAVRAAAILAGNLERGLRGRPLRRWRPQQRALQLLGDGGATSLLSGGGAQPRAVALWGRWALGPSRWLWRWKDRIDRRFMERLGGIRGAMRTQAAMACRGCGAKLAAAPLAAALAEQGLIGPAEDASVIGRCAGGELLLQSVDGFPALVDDPWLNARLTTLHACGDLWACGAAVESVQALVTLPESDSGEQRDLLSQTLAGIRSVLDPLGARLAGGHTLEGRDGAGLSLALSVTGRVAEEHLWPKGPLVAGQALLLSEALGTGVLFAAAMTGAARADWLDTALTRMQQSPASLVPLLQRYGCRACTDITGFGLLGHLGEMLATSPPGTCIALEPGAIPALPGALQLLEQGHASSLAPANAGSLALLEGPVQCTAEPTAGQQQLWIDPQTCGPLLAALPADQAPLALAALQAAGFNRAALIGRVIAG